MADSGFVKANVEAVRERMAAACVRAGRPIGAVELMAVTKFHPLEAVEAAWYAGVMLFGESRVQEAEAKYPGFLERTPGARLHMIGHLQSNKARKVTGLFACVQSVDSVELLLEIERRASAADVHMDALLELHTGEESKCGFPDAASLLDAVKRAGGLESVRIRGLMTMAPYTDDERPIRASFRTLAATFLRARDIVRSPCFDVLSMGMTNDFEIAIEEGSTLIRIGTAIFGRGTP
ncbi:MAG: YggS family pyridoxal phosphate-dependent enzyme [Spirochaetes bacterium]|nr:YggS family pyridoxal phosphate-dependent enzyme [Spirochaetota bacterium]